MCEFVEFFFGLMMFIEVMVLCLCFGIGGGG